MKSFLVIFLVIAAVGSLGAEALLYLGPGLDLMTQDLGSRGELNFAGLGLHALVFSGGRLGFLAAASLSFLPVAAELDGVGLSLGSFHKRFSLETLWAAGYRIVAAPRFGVLAAAGLHSAQISLVHETDPLQVFGREIALGAGVNLSAHYRLVRRLLFTMQIKGAYDFLSFAYFQDPELKAGLSLGGSAGLSVVF